MNRNIVLWISIPLGILCLLAASILALPSLVSSAGNRSAIEALASSATGRKVHIAGNLSLSLFPEPQLVAGNVTIDGQNGETIKAKSLTLDIAMPALLRGQLTASALMLQSPVIAFPWPLPDGPATIAPPPWLAALHAQINNGRISFGSIIFSNVVADIFTGADGAVSIAGTGVILAQPLNITLSLGAANLAGQAPLAAQLSAAGGLAHFTGMFSTDNSLTGTLAASQSGQAWLSGDATQKLSLSATVNATPQQIALTGISLVQGSGTLSGTASVNIVQHELDLMLSGANINFPTTLTAKRIAALPDGVIHDEISVDHLTVNGMTLPHLIESSDISNQGLTIRNATASLPGNNSANFNGTVDRNGSIKGALHLTTNDFASLAATTDASVTAETAELSSSIAGSLTNMKFANITGLFDDSPFDGSGILQTGTATSINGQFHIKQINLLALGNLLRSTASKQNLNGNFEISADRGSFGTLSLNHILIDGGLSHVLTIRQLSASFGDGIIAGSLTLQPDGTISEARGFLTTPSGAILPTIFGSKLGLPPAIFAAPLAISLSAAGSTSALKTSAAITLGQFSISLSPVIDLTKATLHGAVTLRHPSAITALKLLGMNAGLPWPGAGSVSLRADMSVSGDSFALPNFVFSMGALTASGDLSITSGNRIDGSIDADTLALPPMPNDLSSFWKILPSLNGKIAVTANRIMVAGSPWLGATQAALDMQPGKLALNVTRAAFGGGNLQSTITVTQAVPKPPTITTSLNVQKTDLSQISYPFAFPIALPSGLANFNATTTMNGFTPQTWAATLAGTLSLHVENGTLSGFDLTGLGTALNAPNRGTMLQRSAETGTSPFNQLDMAGNVDHGLIKLQNAQLHGGAGAATATGSVDLTDNDLALNFGLMPNVTPGATIGLAIIGSWSNPHKVPSLKSVRGAQHVN